MYRSSIAHFPCCMVFDWEEDRRAEDDLEFFGEGVFSAWIDRPFCWRNMFAPHFPSCFGMWLLWLQACSSHVLAMFFFSERLVFADVPDEHGVHDETSDGSGSHSDSTDVGGPKGMDSWPKKTCSMAWDWFWKNRWTQKIPNLSSCFQMNFAAKFIG